jgi:hypothetical protein
METPHDHFRRVVADTGHRIAAIRAIRKRFGLDLRQAKEVMLQAEGTATSLAEHEERIAAAMTVGPLKLYWKNQLVGVITESTWSDFPWIAGRFEAQPIPNLLREVLTWFASQAKAEELQDPPFDADLVRNWAIVKPDQSRVELLLPPIVDFIKGLAEWRE